MRPKSIADGNRVTLTTGSVHGRGARQRHAKRAENQRRAAIARWRQPGVVLFFVALAFALAGWLLVLRDAARIPVERATIDGMEMELLRARWLLDQMDHGENYQKPAVMMPDMPAWGDQRVTLELSFTNQSAHSQAFDGAEFFLVPEFGDETSPMGANVGNARLLPGQTLNTALHFDFDTREPHGWFQVEWRRGGETVHLPVPAPAEHYHLRPRGEQMALPRDARLLIPLGKAARGEALFEGTYGCIACHGDVNQPGSNNVGPHLAGIGATAGERIVGVAAQQYIYDSIIDPGAFVAPNCRFGPCPEPSGMPEYASLLSLQDAADLLAYLSAANE